MRDGFIDPTLTLMGDIKGNAHKKTAQYYAISTREGQTRQSCTLEHVFLFDVTDNDQYRRI